VECEGSAREAHMKCTGRDLDVIRERGGGNQIAIMSASVNSLLEIKHKLQV